MRLLLTLIVVALGLGPAWGHGGECPGDRLLFEGVEHTVVSAPIDEAKVAREGSAYVVRGVSGLPNGCHRFHQARAERQGNRFLVTVTNVKPSDPDVICTMIYGMRPFEVPLGGGLESGQGYTVVLNGETELTFTAE